MKRTRKTAHGAAAAAVRQRGLLIVLSALAVTAMVAGGWWCLGRRAPAFEMLHGRWVRPDGGYVIDVRGIAADGTMDAAYFNPRAIHVARASAALSNDTVTVFIELRDVNYPGSIYRLTYDREHGYLIGTYFQAVQQETYNVYFQRLAH